MEQVIPFEWIVGAVFVAVNAYRRYNTPRSNRASTTFQNFAIYFALYLMATLTLYVFCGALFDSSPEIIGALYGLMIGNPNAALPSEVTNLSAPMISALFLTTLLPSLPWLSRYDQALLNIFWDRGHIPTHIQRMAASMRRAPFNFAPLQIKMLKQRAGDLGIDFARLDLSSGITLDFRWARINALLDGIAEWQDDDAGRLRRFMQENRSEVDALALRREEVNHEFVDLRAEQLEPHVLRKIERLLDKAIAELLRDISLFVARAACVCEFTESGRYSRTAQLGFEGGMRAPDRFLPNQLAQAVAAIFITFFLVSLIQEFNKEAEFRRFGNIAFMTFLMVFTYGAALWIALDLKRRVGMGYNELTRSRPWPAYLVVGALTAASWFLVTFSYRYVAGMLEGVPSETNLHDILQDIRWSFPYALQSLALAVSISWILDFHQSRDLHENRGVRLRLFDVAIATLALGGASVLAYCWMEGVGLFEGAATRDPQFIGRTSLAWFLVKGISVGAVLGWLVPQWYYINRSKAPDQIAGRLIAMNRDGLAKEIRNLQPDQLVNLVAAVAASVATIDKNVNRAEIDVYQIICARLSGLPNSDLDMNTAEKEFERCQRLIEDEALQLEPQLDALEGLPLLSSLMPYIASSIAFADGVFLEHEQSVVERIRRHVETGVPAAA